MQHVKRHSPAALIVAALCVTAPHTTNAQSAAASADATTAARVKAALAADPKLLARHIDVSARSGVVHLGGFVESDQDLQLALKDARQIPGVVTVENGMEACRRALTDVAASC